jgi:hypothetical protein
MRARQSLFVWQVKADRRIYRRSLARQHASLHSMAPTLCAYVAPPYNPGARDGSRHPSVPVSGARVELRLLQRRDAELLAATRRQILRTKQVRYLNITNSYLAFIKPIKHAGYYIYHLL